MIACLVALAAGLVTGNAALETEFRLAPGQSATLEGTALRLRFHRVAEDSRCPQDVTCVWEGDAVVAVFAREGTGPERRYELHTSQPGRNAVTHAGYRIRLVRLEPHPKSTVPIPSRDYRAVFVVTRARSGVDAPPEDGV